MYSFVFPSFNSAKTIFLKIDQEVPFSPIDAKCQVFCRTMLCVLYNNKNS